MMAVRAKTIQSTGVVVVVVAARRCHAIGVGSKDRTRSAGIVDGSNTDQAIGGEKDGGGNKGKVVNSADGAIASRTRRNRLTTSNVAASL